ncbi:2-hydroxyacyl-CoA dehydratase [Chloroflexota bacterium]
MFLQEQIERLQRRIKNIEQNPRPDYLKSTKVRYEAELENYTSIVEAWRDGKPFAMLEGVEELTEPLGFHAVNFTGWGDRVTDPQRYLDIVANKFEFPEHSCDRTMAALGLFISGEVPQPRLMISRRIPCEPIRLSIMAAAKYMGVLFFEMARLNSCGEENIQCLAEQVNELIDFAEKSVPGIKYDEEKLLELQAIDEQARQYSQGTYELRKIVPCPISPQDSFRMMPTPSNYSNPAKVLEYCQMYHDELHERAEKRVGGVSEEKLRIAWLATGPYGRDTFDLLSRKGVSLPWFHTGGTPYQFGVVQKANSHKNIVGRKLNALEKVVRRWNDNAWAGSADMWVDPLIKVCRDLKIDAVVDFLQPGCITTKSLKWITAQRLREELGIPTLDLEGREYFNTEASQMDMHRKLEEFIDICIANKN